MEQNPYLYEVFDGMERMSPGGVGTRRKMMKFIPQDREISILDVGCGLGHSSIALAQAFPQARIIAIDAHQDYIRQLNQQAASLGLSQQIQGMVMSMEEMQFPKGQFDVIWAEGSVYIMGFANALETWKQYLRPEGMILCNDLCWKNSTVARRYREAVESVYGELDFYKDKSRSVKDLGYGLVHEFVQPQCDFDQGYYMPLSQRLAAMGEKYPQEPQVKEVIEMLEQEMEVFSNYGPLFAYVYFVMKLEA